MNGIIDLIPAFAKGKDEEVPEPGTEGNEWFGVKRITNGQEVFHAFSGAERRRIRRANARYEAKRQKAGERAYNCEQRKIQFKTETRRAQLRILKGELEVTPAMLDNLTRAVIAEKAAYERAPYAEELAIQRETSRDDSLRQRREARFFAGKPRGKDLRSHIFALYSHLLPFDYAGKGGRS